MTTKDPTGEPHLRGADERKGELHVRQVPLSTTHQLRMLADLLQARGAQRRSMPEALTFAVKAGLEKIQGSYGR